MKQEQGITVGELIEILSKVDQSLPVATEAMGSVYASRGNRNTHGPLRVCLLRHYSQDHILIGNPSRKNLNGSNWFITEDLTGEEYIPYELKEE